MCVCVCVCGVFRSVREKEWIHRESGREKEGEIDRKTDRQTDRERTQTSWTEIVRTLLEECVCVACSCWCVCACVCVRATER